MQSPTVHALALHAGGTALNTASHLAGFGDGAVCCWDTNGGAKAWKAKGRGDKVTAMLSTRGLLAVGDDGGRIALRDARLSGDRGPAISTQPHADYVSGLCAIRDEILVSAGADGVRDRG